MSDWTTRKGGKPPAPVDGWVPGAEVPPARPPAKAPPRHGNGPSCHAGRPGGSPPAPLADAPVAGGLAFRAWDAAADLVVVQVMGMFSDGRLSPGGLLSFPAEDWTAVIRPALRRLAAAEAGIALTDDTGLPG